MAICDFMYEDKIKTCPVDEQKAAEILRWLGIGAEDAQKYSGISTCRAILLNAVKHYTNDLYPRNYQSIQERQ